MSDCPMTDAVDYTPHKTLLHKLDYMRKLARKLERQNDQLRKMLYEVKEALCDCETALDPTYKIERRSAKKALSLYNELPHVKGKPE